MDVERGSDEPRTYLERGVFLPVLHNQFLWEESCKYLTVVCTVLLRAKGQVLSYVLLLEVCNVSPFGFPWEICLVVPYNFPKDILSIYPADKPKGKFQILT